LKGGALPRYYFPLLVTIILVELVVLVLVLLDILPVHPFHIYPEAGYSSYVAETDILHVSVTVTKWFFFFLTAGVLLSMMLIIILEVIRRIIINYRQSNGDEPRQAAQYQKSPENLELAEARVQGDYITRFNIQVRVQHFLLLSSFIVLAITGIPRGFPEWPVMQWWAGLLGGMENLRLIHNIAAFVMCADVIYHILYIAYGVLVKHKLPSAMMPNFKDLKDTIHTFLWIFGKSKHEPQYDHFTYGQKIDYWVIFWGLPVMVITGAIMMFPAFFSSFLPSEAFAVCAAAHRDEAVLAIGFIIIVHMYYGHLQTIAFPINTVFLTGKMLKSKYQQWFAREYAQIMGTIDEGK
jgi:formate dehydrogenase subunit gamma